MKIGYFEAMMTPAEVVIDDLQFMDYQQRYGEKQPETTKKKNKQG